MSGLQITIVLGSIVTVLAYYVMFKYAKSLEGKTKRFKDKKIKTTKEAFTSGREGIEDKIGIKSIGQNIITQKDGTLCVVLEYSTPDIPSLTQSEIAAYEDALRRVAITLPCNIKVIEYAGAIKTVKANRHLLRTTESGILTEQSKAYGRMLYESLGKKQYDRSEVEKKKYVVLGVKESSFEDGLNLIKSYTSAFVTSLSKARVSLNLLDTTQDIDLCRALINHGTRLDVAAYENSGGFELIGSGGLKS